MKLFISQSRQNTKTLLKTGKAVRVELLVSTGDGFAERLTKFLSDVSSYTSAGSSRSIGMLEPSSDEERALKIFIDGDGADRIFEVKIAKD